MQMGVSGSLTAPLVVETVVSQRRETAAFHSHAQERNRRMSRSTWWVEGLNEMPGGYLFAGPQMDFDTFRGCVANVGNDNAAALLDDLRRGGYQPNRGGWDGGKFLSDVPGAVAYAWSILEFPEGKLHRDLWLELFREAGYTRNGNPASRPSKPVQLYRGATEDPDRPRLLGMFGVLPGVLRVG